MANKNMTEIDTLKRHGEIFNGICNLSLKLNSMFSGPILVLFLVYFIVVISSMFLLIFGLVSGNTFMKDYYSVLITGTILNSFRILILLSTADIPLDQVSCYAFVITVMLFSIISFSRFVFFVNRLSKLYLILGLSSRF